MSIDSTIATIICRELLEGAMFVISHLGAVYKNDYLDDTEKQSYVRTMGLGLLAGFLSGAAISIGVGFAVQKALSNSEDVDGGVEAGEGASKLIAFFFVAQLAFKLPKWFGISNYGKTSPESSSKPMILDDKEVKSEDMVLTDVEKASDAPHMDSKYSMALSLFWNSWRESTEGGVFTALIVVLAADGLQKLGPSVAIGVGSALFAFLVMSLGSRYVSASGFAILATVIIQALATGLIAGSVRAFEEVYDIQHNGINSGIVFKLEDERGDVLEAFGFIGIGREWTKIVIVTWVFSIVFLALGQYWNNYLGYSFIPSFCKKNTSAEKA